MFKNIFSRVSYVCFFLLIALAYRFYVSYLFLLIMAAMIVFPLFSTAVLHYSKSRLEFTLTSPVEIEEGSFFEAALHIKNRGLFPVIKSSFSLSFENLFYRQDDTFSFSCGIPSGKETVLRVRLDNTYSGMVLLGIADVRIWDYTGMADTAVLTDCHRSVLILPKVLEASFSTEAVGGAGLTELVDQDTKGNDSSQIIDTRDYQPGDKPSRIHWKLSTKLDKLLVKEYGSISSNDVLVVLELCRQSTVSPNLSGLREANECLDACLSVYYTLMEHLINEKRPFTLCFYSASLGELKTSEITSLDEGKDILNQLYYETPGTGNDAYSLCKSVMDDYSEFIYVRPEIKECTANTGGEVLFSCTDNDRILASAVSVKL